MISDQEIWLVSGVKPVVWTQPVIVAWKTNYRAYIRPACPSVPVRCAAALEHKLAQFCRRLGGNWLVDKGQLAANAKKLDGVEPEDYFSWALATVKYDSISSLETELQSEFLDAFYQFSALGRSRGELSVLFQRLCEFMRDWFLNHEKTVDFRWFKLHPSPFRANWKQLLWSFDVNKKNHRRLLNDIRRCTVSDLNTLFRRRKFFAELQNGKYLGFEFPSGIAFRRIELEHTLDWWKTVKQQERALMEQFPNDYVQLVKDRMARAIPIHLKAFIMYAEELSCCPAALSKSGVPGAVGLQVNTDPTYYFAKRVLFSRDPSKTGRELRDEGALPETDGAMPAVPAVQPPPQDVRDCWNYFIKCSTKT